MVVAVCCEAGELGRAGRFLASKLAGGGSGGWEPQFMDKRYDVLWSKTILGFRQSSGLVLAPTGPQYKDTGHDAKHKDTGCELLSPRMEDGLHGLLPDTLQEAQHRGAPSAPVLQGMG